MLLLLALQPAHPSAPEPPGPNLDEGEGEQAPLGPELDEGDLPLALAERARSVQQLPVGARMAAISELLVDRPYLNDAAGEGRAPDLDPPVRYDAWDCLTFVEEVLALALAGDPTAAPRVRESLRYGEGGGRLYEDRHHFMLEQWVPRAIANGWLEDITAQVGETHLIRKRVTPRTWAGWGKRRLFQVPDDKLPTGDYALPVMSTGAALESIDQIPDGALILTVRRPREGVPIVVTHLGFKLPGSGQPLMRHATKMGSRPRVRNERLAWYLEHVEWYHHWPVEGVNILMPRDFGPRRSRLPAG